MVSDAALHGAESAASSLDLDDEDAIVVELYAIDGIADEPEAPRIARPLGGPGGQVLHGAAVAGCPTPTPGLAVTDAAAEPMDGHALRDGDEHRYCGRDDGDGEGIHATRS